MNRYGQLAYDQASQHRPKFFASMTDPTAYFSQLGEEIQSAISELRDQLLGSQHRDETLEDYRRRSYQALRQAEEVVLADTVWTEPEATLQAEDDEILASRSQLAMISTVLSGLDRAWTDVAPEAPPP